MVKISTLFLSVLTLFCFMIPGFLLRKAKLANENFAKALSIFTLYVAQVAMLFHGFLFEFDKLILRGVVGMFVMAFVAHVLFYLFSLLLFPKAPGKQKCVLRFAVVFSNAGYMGIPVINDVFGSSFTIYATAFVIWFNVFAFTLGRLIYTNDKKYISVKEAILNPAVIPILLGLIVYLTGLGGVIRANMEAEGFTGQALTLFYNVLTAFKNMVAPASMLVVGARLADVDFKGIWKDKYFVPFLLLRLFVFPAVLWGIMKLISLTGLIDQTVMSIMLILSSTPAAAMTAIFAELYDGDAPYAGKLVAASTVLSVVTMPVVALLLQI